MPATTSANPISDLMYDWLTVLQSKAEGLNAYEKYIQDAGHLSVRRLRPGAVLLADEVRLRHRLAELLPGGRRGPRRGARRPCPWHGPDRADVQPMRVAPGPRLPRRPAPDRPALLHQ